MLPWDRYKAEWTAKAVWPRVILGATHKVAAGSHELEPAARHHLMLFRASVTVGVINAGEDIERTLHIGAGEVMVRPAGLPVQQHRWKAAAPFELVHAILSPAHCQVPKFLLTADTVYKIPDPLIGDLIDVLHRAALAQRPATDRAVDAATELLCLQFPESLHRAVAAVGSGALDADAFRKVSDHIDLNLGAALRTSALARLAGLSSSHFSRAFKAATGITPMRFVTQRRALLAQNLLRATTKSLAAIARETGFGSQSQFTTAFRRLLGETPGTFRKTHAP